MNAKAVVLAGGCFAVAGIVAYGYGTGKRSAGTAADPMAEALPSNAAPRGGEGTRGEMARMRDELGRLRSQLDELQGESVKPAEVKGAADDESGIGKLSLEQQRAESERQWQEHMVKVAASFAQEPRDAQWSAATTAFVAAALGKDPALAALAGAADCRSTSCRLEVERDDEGIAEKQLLPFLNSLGQTLPEMESDHTTVNGKTRYTLYLKRSRTVAAAAPAP